MRSYQQFLPYGVAMSSTAIALLLTLGLEPLLLRTLGAFFYVAIIVTAGYGGFRPGSVAVVLCTLTINYFFIPPRYQFWTERPDVVSQLVLFGLVAFLINLLTSNFRDSKQKIEQLRQQLAQENAELLRIAPSAAQMGMWDWNIATGKIKWSPDHESLFGLMPGTFDGKYESFEACLHPDDKEPVNQALQQAIQNNSLYQQEFRVLWGDGNIHWIEARGHAFYNEAGQPIHMTGTATAIDERKQAQGLLQQQFEQQRLVMEVTQRIRRSLNLQDILHTTVEEIRQLLQCDRVIIFQFSPSWSGTVVVESVGADWTAILSTEIHDPCIGEKYVEPYKQGLVTAKSDIYTAGIDPCHAQLLANFQVRANLVVPIIKGDELWGLLIAHHCAAPHQWQSSEIDLMRQLASQVSIAIQQSALFEQVQTELTERKQAEAALRESQSQIQRQLAEIETIYQSAPIGLNVLDTELRFVRINQRLAAMNGFPVEAHIGRTLRELLPDLADAAEQVLRPILETGEPLLNVEITGATPAQPGVERIWLESFLPLKDGDRIIGISTVCEEITERKQAEMALQQLNTELEQRVAERTAQLTQVNDLLLEALAALGESEERRRLALDLTHIGFWDIHLPSRTVIWNDNHFKLLGLVPYEIKPDYELWHSRIHPDDMGWVEQRFLESLENGTYYTAEYRVVHPDGSIHWLMGRGKAIYDELGQPVRSLGVLLDISDRKRTEEMLELQAVITQNMAEGICLIRADNSVIVYANPKFEQMFGYDCGELNGQPISIVNYASVEVTPEEVNQSILPAVLERGEATYEVRNVKKDGTPVWCRATASVFKHTDYGDVFVAVHQDITARKQAEVILQQQAQQQQLLLNITQAIRQSLDLSAVLNTAVTEVRQTLQVERAAVYRFNPDWSGDFVAESVGRDWVKLVEPNRQKAWEDTYLQETQGGRFRNNESFIVADIYSSGLQPCHIELLEQFQAKAYAIAPIFSGEALWGLLAIYENTTSCNWQSWEVELLQQIASQLAIAIQQSELYEQLQTELHERKQAAAVLREAERRWRSLLDNVQLIVVGLDNSGNINYVNPFFLNLTGYTDQEVLGKNWFEKLLPHSCQESIQTVFAELLNHNAYPYYQNSILTKSGEERFIAWNNTVLQDLEGTTIGMIGIGEDITERQKVEQMKNEFIGIVSHELRTPLTAIKMSLGLLKTGIYDKKPDKFQRMLEIAIIDSNRLVNLVNDILDLERLESGRATLEKTRCPAADLMKEAVNGVQPLASGQQITLTIIPTDAKVWAAADAIIQTLTNLLSNAIKFSPANSTITLSAECETDVVLFRVSDRGRGIPADKLEVVFGRFQQVDASDARQKGGTGLGLAICRSIIDQHGGQIWAESTLGEGSTFFFTLPLPPEDIV